MKNLNVLLVVVCVGLLGSSVFGVSFADVTVTDTVGTGSKTAMCVLDFGAGNSYAFQYFWNGEATSEDLLVDLDAQTDVAVSYTSDPTYGMFISSISYDGNSIVNDYDMNTYTGGWANLWWDGFDEYVDFYNNTIPGQAAEGGVYKSAQVGASTRTLQDGYWDGWTYMNYGTGSTAAPVVPVPEPASMVLLAAGALGVIRKRRG